MRNISKYFLRNSIISPQWFGISGFQSDQDGCLATAWVPCFLRRQHMQGGTARFTWPNSYGFTASIWSSAVCPVICEILEFKDVKRTCQKNCQGQLTLWFPSLVVICCFLRRVKRDSETATLFAPNVSVWEHLGCEVSVSTQLTTWTALTLLAKACKRLDVPNAAWHPLNPLPFTFAAFWMENWTFSESGLCDKWFVEKQGHR